MQSNLKMKHRYSFLYLRFLNDFVQRLILQVEEKVSGEGWKEGRIGRRGQEGRQEGSVVAVECFCQSDRSASFRDQSNEVL